MIVFSRHSEKGLWTQSGVNRSEPAPSATYQDRQNPVALNTAARSVCRPPFSRCYNVIRKHEKRIGSQHGSFVAPHDGASSSAGPAKGHRRSGPSRVGSRCYSRSMLPKDRNSSFEIHNAFHRDAGTPAFVIGLVPKGRNIIEDTRDADAFRIDSHSIDLEQPGIELLTGVQIVNRHCGAGALLVGDRPLP